VQSGYVGAIRQSTLAIYGEGERVWPDGYVLLDENGQYVLGLDDSDPSYNSFYVFSLSLQHYNQMYNGVESTFGLPLKEDFTRPGVIALDGRVSNTGIDFTLQSSMTTEMVLMRDGETHLATDVFRASSTTAAPTILTRTVYNKDGYDTTLTLYGYNVVVQDSRGRFASEGVDPVFRDDAWGENQDGYDTIEWIAAQSWSDGQVGMFGGSALGITQYLTAGAVPPSLVCCYAVVGTGYLYDDAFFTGGVFRKAMVEGWLGGQDSLHFLEDLEAHPNRDAWHDDVDISTRIEQINVPFFHFGGWFDIFIEGATRGFHNLQNEGANGAIGTQKLLIGPWTHSGVYDREQGELVFPENVTSAGSFPGSARFFDYWLKGVDNGLYDGPPIRYYAMGDVDDAYAPGNEWRDAYYWPPASTPTPLYMVADGTLSFDPPAVPGTVSYNYDPADPVPTVGGNNLGLPAGPYDQAVIEQRDDVLTFTTPALDAPLEIGGHTSVRLYVSSSALDTDFMVKLCDVYPDGRSMMIQEGAKHGRHWLNDRTENLLEPGQTYELDVDLWSTSIIFNTGHRIRVSVTSSNHPRWEANSNTGEPFRQHTHQVVATNTIHCAPTSASHVVLPVITLRGDRDGDGDVDHIDYDAFETCFTGSCEAASCNPPLYQARPDCARMDFEPDGDVDCADWGGFRMNWTELERPPEFEVCGLPIPALSTWGLILLGSLVLVAGTLIAGRPRTVRI
jgi:predicted acyl esterase